MGATGDGDRRDGSGIDRRELFKRGGALGALAALPVGAAQVATAAEAQEQLHAISAAESDTLNAFVARLIPTDASGPGATEARVGRYIDRALAGPARDLADAFSAGLAAVDELAQTRFGAAFVALAPEQQDALVAEIEAGAAPGFGGGSGAFFQTIREFALQGMFCDPVQGGNRNFVGWDLLGYYGVRLEYTRRQQRLDVNVRPAHKSVADYSLFRARPPREAKHHGH